MPPLKLNLSSAPDFILDVLIIICWQSSWAIKQFFFLDLRHWTSALETAERPQQSFADEMQQIIKFSAQLVRCYLSFISITCKMCCAVTHQPLVFDFQTAFQRNLGGIITLICLVIAAPLSALPLWILWRFYIFIGMTLNIYFKAVFGGRQFFLYSIMKILWYAFLFVS